MPNTVKYHEQKVVAFIDILGFSNHIRQMDGDDDKAEIVLSIFRNLRRFIQERPTVGIELRFISDTIIITMPIQPLYDPIWRDEVHTGLLTLELCKTIQSGLLTLGFLSRGSVVTGNIVLDGDVIFGIALVEAHRIESRVAKYPRIVIDQSLLQSDALPAHVLNINRHLIETDVDGYKFVNFLGWELEVEGLWFIKSSGQRADAVSVAASCERDKERASKDLKFFLEARPILESMYDRGFCNQDYREKIEWIINLYNRQMDQISNSPRAAAFGLISPEKIALRT